MLTVHVRVWLLISAGTAVSGGGGGSTCGKVKKQKLKETKNRKIWPSLKLFCVTAVYSLQHDSMQ